MEIFIAISSGIAFLALIVYLWNADKDPKKSTPDKSGSKSTSTHQPSQQSATTSAVESKRIAILEQHVESLTRERSELTADIERYKQREAAPEPATDHEAILTEYSRRMAALETENSTLRAQLVEFDTERSGYQQQLANLTGIEKHSASLEKENSALLERLEILQRENETSTKKILALQDVAANHSQLEARIADLSDQNGRLTSQLSSFQTSLRDKLKLQLDGLQELYQNLMSPTK